MSCSTLNDSPVVTDTTPSGEVAAVEEAARPRKFAGMRPWRKSSQVPVRDGAAARSSVTAVLVPGWNTNPSPIPIVTAIRAVIPQQGLAGEAGAIGDHPQVGNGGDDGGEHQRRHDGAEQVHKRGAEGAEGDGEPVVATVGGGAEGQGEPAEEDAQDQCEADLGGEGWQAQPGPHHRWTGGHEDSFHWVGWAARRQPGTPPGSGRNGDNPGSGPHGPSQDSCQRTGDNGRINTRWSDTRTCRPRDGRRRGACGGSGCRARLSPGSKRPTGKTPRVVDN